MEWRQRIEKRREERKRFYTTWLLRSFYELFSGFGKNDNDEAILGKIKGGCFVVLCPEWVVGPFSAAERRQVVLPCGRHDLAR